jgi:hypothetical protein
MTLFQEQILKDQDDNLSMIYTINVYSGPDPDDDDDWVSDDDDDDFDQETGDDIDEDYVNPNVIPDTPDLDEDDDEDTWVDDDEDFISDDEDEDEDITLQSDDDDVSEADRLSRGDLGGNFEDRPYGKNRRTGRMIDHEPGSTGSSGSGDPNLE